MRLTVPALLILLVCGGSSSRAEDSVPVPGAAGPGVAQLEAATGKPSRTALRLSVSYLNTFLSPFPGTSTSGVGPSFIYEFLFTPKFVIGIHLAYRWFTGSPSLTWFGYGFMLKHYVSDEREAAGFRPYFEYGLLVAGIRSSQHTSYSLGHDTRLTVGTDYELSPKTEFLGWIKRPALFLDATYHLSWLGYFDTASINMMAAEFNLGVRFRL